MSEHNPYGTMHATTIITVKEDGMAVMAGDGQVSLGKTGAISGPINAYLCRTCQKLAHRQILALTDNSDVLEPEHGTMAIGSGGNYAYAAARALMDTDMSAEDIARKAMGIAGEICVYTNHNFVVETLETSD